MIAVRIASVARDRANASVTNGTRWADKAITRKVSG